MTTELAKQKGYTHFIEVWDSKEDWSKQYPSSRECERFSVKLIEWLDNAISSTKQTHTLQTTCIFLIKEKINQNQL